MTLSAVRIISTVVLIYSSIVSDNASYHTKYEEWERDFKNLTIYCQGCLDEAIEKAKKFYDYNQEEKNAVIIVNIYAQEGDIYKILNKQLQCGSLSPFMRKSNDLLNSAIDILSERETFSIVFYGTNACYYTNEPVVHFKIFTRTNADVRDAGKFSGSCGMLLVIRNAKGISMAKYSTYSTKKEVLLKSNTSIVQTKLLTNRYDIQTELDKNWPTFQRKITKFFDGVYTGNMHTYIIDECPPPSPSKHAGSRRVELNFACFFAYILVFIF